MNVVHVLTKLRFLPTHRLIELYPPFLMMGVKITYLSNDYRTMGVRVPLRWYSRNFHGSMFGGWLCAVSDPFHALLCGRLIPGLEVWSKANAVEFKRPARTDVEFQVTITDDDLAEIRDQLSKTGKATHTFQASIRDLNHEVVAHVKNTVFLRKRDTSKHSESQHPDLDLDTYQR
jgi:acyl-coenzyme A thioesterase PaaI-like protein